MRLATIRAAATVAVFALPVYHSEASVVVNFAGAVTNVESSGTVDAISQYIAAGDTFTGRFTYDPDSEATSTLETINNVGQWLQYGAAPADFLLRFTSGNSAGLEIRGLSDSQSRMSIADNVLNSSSGPLVDITSGILWHPNAEFRPGLTQRNFVYRFWDFEEAAMSDSANLSDWDADQAFANLDTQINELAFNSTQTGYAQIADVTLTSFSIDSSPPAVSDPVNIPIETIPVEVSVLGGSAGSSPGGLSAVFDPVATAGDFQASYDTVGSSEFASSYAGTSGFDLGNFLTTGPGGDFQVWDLDFTGTIADGGQVTLQFKYDDAGMTEFEESMLGIWHYGEYGPNGERQWQWLRDSIDTVGNIITITTDNFSPFTPGFQAAASVAPEPAQLLVWGGIALCGALAQCFRTPTPRR